MILLTNKEKIYMIFGKKIEKKTDMLNETKEIGKNDSKVEITTEQRKIINKEIERVNLNPHDFEIICSIKDRLFFVKTIDGETQMRVEFKEKTEVDFFPTKFSLLERNERGNCGVIGERINGCRIGDMLGNFMGAHQESGGILSTN